MRQAFIGDSGDQQVFLSTLGESESKLAVKIHFECMQLKMDQLRANSWNKLTSGPKVGSSTTYSLLSAVIKNISSIHLSQQVSFSRKGEQGHYIESR